jgi:UDP-N-acetylglucosamine--N-acetylmuramyl-(pentapeptide) pyrophosphoryl-undecaprenol N-acetylglucosamine transferase
MKKIVLTGGGTAGHVTPNIALLPGLKKAGYEIYYIGSKDGMEKALIENEGIPYYGISAGKLRRYFDAKNFTDTLRIVKGFNEAIGVLRKIKPDIVFSKGGFVSSPVVWAAKMKGIPVVIHESDMTPGLANRLALPFAKKICYTFPETSKHIPENKGVFTGLPVRDSLLKGDAERGRSLCGFRDSRPVIVVIGGSQGSVHVNTTVREALKDITSRFNLCHICGRGNMDEKLNGTPGYKQFEYISDELKNIFAMADIVISRAGATVIFELLALRKPNLLIPLSANASRGDQILNSRSFEKQGFSRVLEEDKLTAASLRENIEYVYKNREAYKKAMEKSDAGNSLDKMLKVIKENTR